jgi:glycyl-tRNA synthetase beta chain
MTLRPKGVLLLEIGTEEIPARMIEGALEDLALAVRHELDVSRLVPPVDWQFEKNSEVFGTPRRLALRVTGLLERQPDTEDVVTGPPVKAAFDAAGRPTKAAEGFARALGVAATDLRRIGTPKGECVGLTRRVEGRPATDLLASRLPAVLGSLSFPKMMRWGTGEFRFVRPIHWLVALLDRTIVDFTFAGIRSGNRSTGHRSRGANEITIADPMTYVERLREHGVMAGIEERTKTILDQLDALAAQHHAVLATPPGAASGAAGDPELLRDVTHMAEWPHVVAGEFDAGFLELPEEILVTAMRHHQKAFSLRRTSGALLNRFLAISDTVGDPRQAIRKGNEWVLRARLADARFFWNEDRRTTLSQHAASLERVTFHEKLGSFADKSARTTRLAGAIVDLFARSGSRADESIVAEAARLCKADLTTQMVKEFPELEGIVGGLYAAADGLPAGVARAIGAHYLPRGVDDPLPGTAEGSIVSLADRLDTQAGIFLLGIVPTGSRDPYGLRRSVLGVCRILIENKFRASLSGLIDEALQGYAAGSIEGSVPAAAAKTSLLDFYRGRLQFMGEEAGLRQDSVRAALAASADDPYAARQRMSALDAIRDDAGFMPLVLAHKRIKNILKDRAVAGYEASRLKEDAERGLDQALGAVVPAIETAQARSDHVQALRELARLGPTLDRFFSEVMVMAEDTRLRDNRLGLLDSIAGLFLRVGDFSEIVVDGESAKAAAPRDRAGARPGGDGH